MRVSVAPPKRSLVTFVYKGPYVYICTCVSVCLCGTNREETPEKRPAKFRFRRVIFRHPSRNQGLECCQSQCCCCGCCCCCCCESLFLFSLSLSLCLCLCLSISRCVFVCVCLSHDESAGSSGGAVAGCALPPAELHTTRAAESGWRATPNRETPSAGGLVGIHSGHHLPSGC